MRTLDEIFHDNHDVYIEHEMGRDTVHALGKESALAAMKEAREDTLKEFMKFIVDTDCVPCSMRSFHLTYKGVDQELTHDQLIVLFSKHLAAIEAEKERGKG